jgi:hypothetical protein
MPNTLRIKRRLTGASGAPSSLAVGELAYNKVDDRLYLGLDSGIITLAGHGEYAKKSDLSSEVSTLNSSISSETSRATAAEAALGTRIDNVLSNVDGAALDSLTEVVSAFQSADSTLNGAITSLANSASSALTSEVNRATAAEGVIAAGLAQELLDRAAADTTLQGNINTVAGNLSTETSARTSADSTLTSNLSSEISRATAAEGVIAANLATEITDRAAAVTAVTNSLNSEISRATAAEASLDSRLDALETEIDGGTF